MEKHEKTIETHTKKTKKTHCSNMNKWTNEKQINKQHEKDILSDALKDVFTKQ